MAQRIRFSDFKHRLTVQRAVLDQDQNTGEPVKTWVDLGTVWASITPQVVRSRESEIGGVILSETFAYIRMRWGPISQLITAADRGVHQGSVYDFVNVVPSGKHFVEITAKSGVTDG